MSSKGQDYGKHVVLTEALLTDPKWNKLSSSAKTMWILLRRQYRGSCDTSIKLAPSLVKEMISYRSFWRGVKQLISIGWLEILEHGGIPKRPNKYKLKGPHGFFIRKKKKLW